MKEINNIVNYTSIVDGKKVVKSCIFYTDGRIEEVSYDEAVVITKKLLQTEGKTLKDFKEMLNKDTFYAMTEEEFKERFDSFKPAKEFEMEDLDEAIKKLESIELKRKDKAKEEETIIPVIQVYEPEEDTEPEEEVVYEEEIEDIEDSEYEDFTEEEQVEETDESESDHEYRNNGLKIAATFVAGALAIVGCAYILNRCSKTGKLTSTDTTATTTFDNNNDNSNISETTGDDYIITDGSTYELNNNDLYNDFTFGELLDVTNNDFQKSSMINVSSSLNGFNIVFANNYTESGHDIKAALSFDEVVALQQAYNNYSTDEVRAYFNGNEVDAVYMSNAYKSASLQLMGAYTIESSENPVDMSILIDSQEGRDFYNRYHAMFLAAKEATGDEQIRLVKEFYAAVEKDFPITEEVRTEGISHSEDHNSLKDYQLSVVPMIASAEMIFQNLGIDHTLDNTSIDFINDIGLCNHADDKFERIETIMLGAYEDNTNPLFIQYKNAIITDLINSNSYVIDDAHRELSNLRRFQGIVNHDELWKHRTTYTGQYGQTYTDSTSTTTVVSGDVSDEDKAKVDEETNKQNEENKKKAEEEAEAERKRQQEEADKNKKSIENEIAEDDRNLQKDIDDANSKINNGQTPNENDYNNIDFDDNHSNGNGDLDNSVKNITTDGSGANQDLPDPNDYGKDFDSRVPERSYTVTYTVDNNAAYVEYAGEGNSYIEYDYEYTSYDGDGNPITTEGYQYTR